MECVSSGLTSTNILSWNEKSFKAHISLILNNFHCKDLITLEASISSLFGNDNLCIALFSLKMSEDEAKSFLTYINISITTICNRSNLTNHKILMTNINCSNENKYCKEDKWQFEDSTKAS